MKNRKSERGLLCNSLNKKLLIMRISILLLIVGILQVNATDVYSQKTKLSIRAEAISLNSVLDKIEKESEFFFLYNEKLLDINRTVSINVKDRPITDILENLFAGTDITYQIIDRKIILIPSFLIHKDVEESGFQNHKITGKVTDASNGELIIGANIVVEGTTIGAVSDVNGNFSIEVPAPNSVLVVSFVGYNSEKIQLGGQTMLDIKLIPDIKSLEEVVVVGYGIQKKATVTGSVVAINNEQLLSTKNSNVQNMLTGKLPGLRVVQKTSEPGQFTNQFDIRGFGTPLFVVDGVPRGDFPRMDPNDIESISILKDASAAIYGVRAANGVVLITTKTGIKQKASIEYSGYYGIQTPAEILNPLNALDRALLYNETTMRSTTNPYKQYKEEELQAIRDGKLPDTDWYHEILRSTAPQQQHNVTVRGGADKIDYFVNLGYNNQGSFFKTNCSNYERYNFRTNLNVSVIDNLKASIKLNYIMDQTKRQNYDSWTIFAKLWRSKPTDPVYANNTEPYFNHPTSGDIENIVPLIHPELSGEKVDKKNILQSNFSLNYQFPFIKNLSANFMFSFDKTYNDDTNFKKAFDEYTYDAGTGRYTRYERNAQTQLTRTFNNSQSKLWNASLNYDNKFGAHHIGGLLLFEESYSQGYDFHAMRYYSIPIAYLFAGDTKNQEGVGSGLSEKANKALVGRINYDFSGKYLFEYSFRYDGSSLFPKGKQWGFFPSVQLGYRISEESFIRDNLSFVNNLKFKGSWGKVGDDDAARFQFVSGYDYPASGGNRTSPAGAVFGNTFINSLGFRNAPNPNITWYSSTIKNLGLEMDLWRGLLGLSVDIFQRDREGLLAAPDVVAPGTFGSGISDANLNADRTKGLEVEIRHRNNIGEDFTYNFTGFVSLTRTMLTKKIQPKRTNSYDYWRNDQVDRYTDIWFGKGSSGVFQSYEDIANSVYSNSGTLPGDPIYQDWNGDGVIDGDDDHPIATTLNPGSSFQDQRNYPLMNFGFTIGAQYKWFDLTMQFQGSAMAYVSYGEQLLNPLSWDGNALPILFDRWHPTNPNLTDPYDPTTQWTSGRYPYGKIRAEQNSEFNIQNGSYLRLKSMELGFTMPQNFVMKKMKISKMRLFANAYNLFTITKVIGLDPERPTELYGYMYPLNRTFNFGGTITF